jgi:GNAT superfamily N-acetyltransferase
MSQFGSLKSQPLAEQHNRLAFQSGDDNLDKYLHEIAGQARARNVAIVYALSPQSDPSMILGFYTLSNLAVHVDEIPAESLKKLKLGRRGPHPATLIGKLAVDHRYHGQGYGRVLVVHALERALVASERVASTAVVVDAPSPRAQEFYRHFGFIQCEDRPTRLFLPMKTVSMLFPAAQARQTA